MSSEWTQTCWGEVATLEYGKALRDYQNVVGDYPVYGTNGPIGFHDKALCETPGVVVGRKGAYRGVHYSPRPFFVIDTAFYLKPKTSINMRWAYYALLTCDINGMDSGSAIPSTSRDEFYKLPAYIPPLSEQKQIAEFLARIDDRITLLRETNSTLEAIALALFKSWFVDFDPVRAKMEGRTPEGMDEATAALFPDGFETSELGELPRGWRPIRLDSFLELAYGKALKAENRSPGPVPVYGSGGITGWHNTSLIDGPSIIVGRKGTVGSLYWESRPFYPIDTVFYLKSKRPLTYCHQLLKTLGLQGMNTDAAVPGLNRENVYRLLVADAPEGLLAAFDASAKMFRQNIDHNEAQAQTLSTLRDTLLPRLIAGKLRLPEAQSATESIPEDSLQA